MKVSLNYRSRLDNYLEWETSHSPLGGHAERYIFDSFKKIQFPLDSQNSPVLVDDKSFVSAAESMFSHDTYGTYLPVNDLALMYRYIRGKANRDWWTKEIGWWNRHGVYLPEEFLNCLHPLCFIELFGREPIAELIRYCHDNEYSNLAFKMDMKIKVFLDSNQSFIYFQRDNREEWYAVILRLIRLRFTDPWIWHLKSRLKRMAQLSRRPQ